MTSRDFHHNKSMPPHSQGPVIKEEHRTNTGYLSLDNRVWRKLVNTPFKHDDLRDGGSADENGTHHEAQR